MDVTGITSAHRRGLPDVPQLGDDVTADELQPGEVGHVTHAEDSVLGTDLGGSAEPLDQPVRRERATGPIGVIETWVRNVFSMLVVVAADRLAVPPQHLVLVAQLLGVGAEHVAGVGVPGHELERASLATASDEDGRMRTATAPAAS